MTDSTGVGDGGAHLDEATLNDFADARLSPARRATADAHLTACEACRDALHVVREVIALGKSEEARTAVPGLSVEPPPELWPIVAATTVHERLVRRHMLRSMRGTLLAAALVLMGAASVTTVGVMRVWERGRELKANGPPPLPRLPSPRRGGRSLEENERATVERQLAAHANAERAAFRAVPPERQGLLSQELAALDSVLDVARAAVLAVPRDADRMRAVEEIYRRRQALIARSIQSR